MYLSLHSTLVSIEKNSHAPFTQYFYAYNLHNNNLAGVGRVALSREGLSAAHSSPYLYIFIRYLGTVFVTGIAGMALSALTLTTFVICYVRHDNIIQLTLV